MGELGTVGVDTWVPGELNTSSSSSLEPSLGEDWVSGFLLLETVLPAPKRPRIRGVLAGWFLEFPSSEVMRTSLWRAWMCSGKAETDNFAIARAG